MAFGHVFDQTRIGRLWDFGLVRTMKRRRMRGLRRRIKAAKEMYPTDAFMRRSEIKRIVSEFGQDVCAIDGVVPVSVSKTVGNEKHFGATVLKIRNKIL